MPEFAALHRRRRKGVSDVLQSPPPYARVTTGASSVPDSGMGSPRTPCGCNSPSSPLSSVASSESTTSGARNPPDWCRHSLA